MLALFGAVCYSISPSGARALSKLCIPVRSAPVTVAAVNRTFAQRDICIAMLECFPRMNAFASFPPLVVTKNDHSQSTVLNHSTAEGRT
jgi:hypothetical protein